MRVADVRALRRANKVRAMPQDGSIVVEKTPTRDFSRVVIWDSTRKAEADFAEFTKRPPLHSVVIHIEPSVAKWLLDTSNKKNRPLAQQYAERMSREVSAEDYELTGDTIKFAKTGACLDGQHRLHACALQASPIVSHVVFGLDDAIFDVIDQGRKRTPGDVLALCGVRDYNIVAGAVRWALQISEGKRGETSRGMTARRIRELAVGPMRDIARYTKTAFAIGKAFKLPPTMVAGLLYLISRRGHDLAEQFAADWQHGNRNYKRNQNFDVLLQRMTSIRAQSSGHLNRTTLAALFVQVFNHWNADVTASTRALTWNKKLAFPTLEFDGAAFAKRKDEAMWSEQTLKANQQRIVHVLSQHMDATCKVTMQVPKLAALANVPERQVSYILRTLISEKALYIDRKGVGGKPTVYRLSSTDKRRVA